MSERAPEGRTPSAFAQEVWDDESPAQGLRLDEAVHGVMPGTSQDIERGPDAWLENPARQSRKRARPGGRTGRVDWTSTAL
jgi:hypothetical protein